MPTMDQRRAQALVAYLKQLAKRIKIARDKEIRNLPSRIRNEKNDKTRKELTRRLSELKKRKLEYEKIRRVMASRK